MYTKKKKSCPGGQVRILQYFENSCTCLLASILFFQKHGASRGFIFRVSAQRTEAPLALEQALSRLPPSAGRREKRSALGSLGGASSSGGASPVAHQEQMREALLLPGPWRVCTGHLLVTFSQSCEMQEEVDLEAWKRHLQEAAI